MNALLDVVRVTAAFAVCPFTETINSIRETAMRFIATAAGIKAPEI
jgi:hypothetical protein